MDKRTPLLWMIPLSPFLFILNGGIPLLIIMWVIYFIYASKGISLVAERDEKGEPTGKRLITIEESTNRESDKWYAPVNSRYEKFRRESAWRREGNDWRGRLIKDINGNFYSQEELDEHKDDPVWKEYGEL